MTGYTVHTGSTQQFSEGWDRIFGSGSAAAVRQATNTRASQAAKTPKSSAKAKPGAKKSTVAATSGKKVRAQRAAKSKRTSGNR